MTQAGVAAIVEDRFIKWGKRLIEAHATPFMLVGFGLDHRQGLAVTCLEEGVTVKEGIAYLEKTVQLLKEKVK